MNKETILGLAVRLFALLLAIEVFRHASAIIPYFWTSAESAKSIEFLLVIELIPALAVIPLWLFPLTVANKILPDIKTGEPAKTWESGEVEIIAYSILGLRVLTGAIPLFVFQCAILFAVMGAGVESSAVTFGKMASATFELAIGFWLLFGSTRIVAVVRRLRHADR